MLPKTRPSRRPPWESLRSSFGTAVLPAIGINKKAREAALESNLSGHGGGITNRTMVTGQLLAWSEGRIAVGPAAPGQARIAGTSPFPEIQASRAATGDYRRHVRICRRSIGPNAWPASCGSSSASTNKASNQSQRLSVFVEPWWKIHSHSLSPIVLARECTHRATRGGQRLWSVPTRSATRCEFQSWDHKKAQQVQSVFLFRRYRCHVGRPLLPNFQADSQPVVPRFLKAQNGGRLYKAKLLRPS
jgi:hypothetical protein